MKYKEDKYAAKYRKEIQNRALKVILLGIVLLVIAVKLISLIK